MNEQEKTGTEHAGKKQRGEFWLKIISVLTAILIWFWVVGVESYVTQKKFTSIKVILENASEMKKNYGYSVLAFTEVYIDVTLEGKNSDLNRVNSDKIYAYIDLNGVSSSGRQSLPIVIDGIDYVGVVSQSQSSAIVYIDRETSISIPVDGKIIQMVREPDVEVGSITLNPGSITVYGPKDVLDTLSHAVVNLSLGNVERPVTVTEKFILVNKDGEEVRNQYISTRDITSIEAYVPVTMTKEITLDLSYKHKFYNDRNTNIKIIPDKIEVRGSPDAIKNMADVLYIDEIDEKQYDTDTTVTRQIHLPQGVTALDGTETADIEIKFIDLDLKTVSVPTRQNSRFVIKSPEKSEYYIKEENISVKVLGTQTILNSIYSSRISITVDLSGFTEKGMYSVPVLVELLYGNGTAFIVGDYTVTAEIY